MHMKVFPDTRNSKVSHACQLDIQHVTHTEPQVSSKESESSEKVHANGAFDI